MIYMYALEMGITAEWKVFIVLKMFSAKGILMLNQFPGQILQLRE